MPVHFSMAEKANNPRQLTSTVNEQTVEIEVTTTTRKVKQLRKLANASRDPMSALFALRACPLEQGDAITMDVLDATVLRHLELTVERGQSVQLGEEARQRPAILVVGKMTRINDSGKTLPFPARHLSVWLSDDAERRLLKMEGDTDIGICTLELTSYARRQGLRSVAPTELPGIKRAAAAR
jgi:hypothetical protein